MEKLKDILCVIVLILCLFSIFVSTATNLSDTNDLPVSNYESETGFYYTYE